MIDVTHIHPMLVHFPIALAMLGFLFEAIELFFMRGKQQRNCGEFILYFATLSAFAALLSGELFTSEFVGKPLEVKELHASFALISTILLSVSCVFYLVHRFLRKESKGMRTTGFIFYLLATISISITGYMGGNLVYSYMIGL